MAYRCGVHPPDMVLLCKGSRYPNPGQFLCQSRLLGKGPSKSSILYGKFYSHNGFVVIHLILLFCILLYLQIGSMQGKLQTWCTDVKHMQMMLEDKAHDIIDRM